MAWRQVMQMNDCSKDRTRLIGQLFYFNTGTMSKTFQSAADTFDCSGIELLLRKAKHQKIASDLIKKHHAGSDFGKICVSAIETIYSDAEVIKIYCQNANVSSLIQPHTTALLQKLKASQPAIFPASIQTIKILRAQ